MISKLSKVGVLGPQGTFSYEAFERLSLRIPGRFELVDTDDNFATILALVNSEVDYIITPVANNVTGPVSETLGFMAQMAYLSNGHRGHPFNIAGEISVPVCHSLVGWKRDNLASITRVLSHPQAIAQCYSWIAVNLPNAKLERCASTSASLKYITGPGLAAIAKPLNLSKGQKVLAQNIHPAGNATRFLVIAQRGLGLPINVKVNKASFVVGIDDEPGSLLKMLQPLATCQLKEIFTVPNPEDSTRQQRIFWLDLEYFPGVDLAQIRQNIFAAGVDRLIDLGTYGSIDELHTDSAKPSNGWTIAGD